MKTPRRLPLPAPRLRPRVPVSSKRFSLEEAARGHQHGPLLPLRIEDSDPWSFIGDCELEAPNSRSIIESHARGAIRGDSEPQADVPVGVHDLDLPNLKGFR